jgi:hypothetical protein
MFAIKIDYRDGLVDLSTKARNSRYAEVLEARWSGVPRAARLLKVRPDSLPQSVLKN